MPKSRTILQVVVGLFLAFGLILSPLQNTTVVFSAQSGDDTIPPADTIPETIAEEPAVEQSPSEQPAPAEVESSPGPVLSEETPAADASIVELVSTLEPDTPVTTEVAVEETGVPDDQDVLLRVEETPALATTRLPDETLPVVQPAIQEQEVAASDPESSDATEESPVSNLAWTSGQAVVRFDPSIPVDEQIARLTGLGLEITASEPALGIFIVNVPEGLEQESASALSVMAGIQYSEPVYLANALDITPNDPGFVNQGDMTAIKAPGGWDYFTGSSSVIIAIVDSGVDLTHPDLAGKIIQGYDFVNKDNEAQDDYGHGTHVAGIAAATGNNAIGIAGLDWSAKIMPVKVLNSGGFGNAVDVADGIVYAVNNGAKIINLSLGFTNNSELVAEAVEYANLHGVTVVASTGNTNGVVTYPAALPHVIGVGAVDNTGARWASSNYGPEVDLVAPGVNVYSTNPSGYDTRTGTSMSAAHVSGLAALLEGMYPLTPVQIENVIETTAKDLGTIGWDSYFGNGLIQVKDALMQLFNVLHPGTREEVQEEDAKTALPMPTITPTPTPTPII